MGFRLIPRTEFLDLLDKNAKAGGKPGRWSVEAGPETVAEWQAAEDHELESGRQAAFG